MGKLSAAAPEEITLIEAAKVGDEDKVRQLLSAGVNPDARDNRELPWNVTPLMYAAERGHLNVMNCLLEAGADVNARDEGIPGHAPGLGTALMYAIYARQEQAAMWLVRRGAAYKRKCGANTPIGQAAYRNFPDLVIELLKKGADPNVKDSDKWTALHYAAHEGHTKIVKILLGAGADVHAANEMGATPLHEAVPARHTEVVKLLLKAGSDVNRQDKTGHTPLLWSASTDRTEIIKMLLDAGADPNYSEAEGSTALDIAIRCEQRKVAELIRRHNGLTAKELAASTDSARRK